MNSWYVNEDTFNPDIKQVRSQETVYTIGNGYFCTRGAFEEDYPRATPATLLWGIFDTVPIAKEELANAPDWTVIKLFVNGERFRLDRGTLLDYHRTLDLQNGTLSRSVYWKSPAGITIKVMTERFASLADEHVGIIRYSVTVVEAPTQHPVDIALWSEINAAQGNHDLLHFATVDQGHRADLLWLHSQTRHTAVQLAQTMSFTTTTPAFRQEIIDSDIAPGIRFYGQLTPDATFTAEKVVVMYTSRDDVDDVVQSALEHHTRLRDAEQERSSTSLGHTTSASRQHVSMYDQLHAQQQAAWQQYWQMADIVVEGDTKAQLGLRYSLYQLRISTSTHDSRYSIAAKGLTGCGYRGHIFHDTEIFMLPFFTYVLPDIVRNLLLYRYRLLPAARKKAASNGYAGVQYPWESTLDGEEATPQSMLHPETGELISVLNGVLEIHITASIAHAVWTYWNVTADDDFMHDYGAEMLLSTAMFWASRVEWHPERGAYEITNVIGPDEWHEHVNNNAYTNFMAKWNMQAALQTLAWLQTVAPTKARELLQQLGLTAKQLDHWQTIQDGLRIPQDKQNGLMEQFDGFFKLARLDQEKYKGRKDSYQAILGVEAVQKYQIIKQADVLMLLIVLNQEFDLQTKRVNWDYYYPITDHAYGSSLTPALHAVLASELGLVDTAYQLFMMGAFVDLDNLRSNTPEGIHLACAGAVWQATILGFAGLQVSADGYTTRAHLPEGWTRLAFNFRHQGELIHVDLRR